MNFPIGILLSHVRESDWYRAAKWSASLDIAGRSALLFLVNDLGSLLSRPGCGSWLARPEYLPSDLDTSVYLAFLTRLSTHSLVKAVSGWGLSDSVVGVLLARLLEGVTAQEKYRGWDARILPGLSRSLAHPRSRVDPARLWRESDPSQRPDLNEVLHGEILARIESNLGRLDLEEVRFLHLYGPRYEGAPDPRELLDLFSLLDLPGAVKPALGQVMRLLPKVNQALQGGGAQTYPIGGYEGLSRQGSLDSLLPTEYAYDEDMFYHRLLNNEALYYGREGEREREKALAWILTQSGLELPGDGLVLSQGLTLALSRSLSQRGYEVRQSFIGSRVTNPVSLNRAQELQRLLYYRDNGFPDPGLVLGEVMSQVRAWRNSYQRVHLHWVVSRHWDADGCRDREDSYRRLQREVESYGWLIRSSRGGELNRFGLTFKSKYFGRCQVFESKILWSGQGVSPPPLAEVVRAEPLPPPGPASVVVEAMTGMELVYIAPGEFMMGSPADEAGRYDDEILHRVVLTRGFYLGRYPVTQGQWEKVMGGNPSYFKKGPDYPVEQVSWDDAQEFIKKINEHAGWDKYRLPTEAEWEYACRAGTETAFYFGQDLTTNQANYDGNYPMPGGQKGVYRQETTPVGSFPSNTWGLSDMHGNVWEWCQDWFGAYPSEAVTDPTGPSSGSYRVGRGGSWGDDARGCRSADRGGGVPGSRYDSLGFRLARTI